MKNEKFSPPGKPAPRYQPRDRKKPTAAEEKRLRALDPDVDTYLTNVLKPMGHQKHRFLRQLYSLYRKLAEPLFIKTLQRALQYRITTVETLEKIAVLLMRESQYNLPDVSIDPDHRHRQSYLDGRFSDEPDWGFYEKMMEDDDE